MVRRERLRDNRDFDTTQLREAGHGKVLARDYSAHFFRWSFARRYINVNMHVLDIGCGQDKPLSKILVGGVQPHCLSYTGVDLNKLSSSNAQRLRFFGDFNFVERWRELLQPPHENGYDVITCFEVVEHMHSKFMPMFMEGCYNCLRSGGTLLLSTPVYDGVHHAANHIRELEIPELYKLFTDAGFQVVRRYGTFMDIKHIGKVDTDRCSRAAIFEVRQALSEYFDNDAISNIFGPLYPDHARNNLWVVRRP